MSFSIHCRRVCAAQTATTIFVVLLSQHVATAATMTYDFSDGDNGWIAGFADYPVGEEVFYELESGHRSRPANLGSAGSFFISGNNHSDDLFMFLKRVVTGLQPNSEYNVAFDVEFASSAPLGSVGVGGSPAESVYFKVGASPSEPDVLVNNLGHYRMNLDKGNQANGGADMITIGNIGKLDDGTNDFTLVSRTSDVSMFSATSDENGILWLIVGTDSGFESTSSLYYTSISAELVVAPVSGDYDFDGDVDGQDFLIWQRDDGMAEGLSEWAANYGAGGAPALATTVPEPSGLALIGYGITAIASFLRRPSGQRHFLANQLVDSGDYLEVYVAALKGALKGGHSSKGDTHKSWSVIGDKR